MQSFRVLHSKLRNVIPDMSHSLVNWFATPRTVEELVAARLISRRPENFKFVEIGVFKGDNAVNIIHVAQQFTTNIFYVGFDLFEKNDEFFKAHPEDRAMYGTEAFPYWEFHSGQHALARVKQRLAAVLSETNFVLIQGDSTTTVPSQIDKIRDATIIFIDGCHDYEIVSQDWKNVAPVFESNPDLVVVFDDLWYSGVRRIKAEIEMRGAQYHVRSLNEYQFFVVSKALRWRNRFLLRRS